MRFFDNILTFFKGKPAERLVTKKTSPAKPATAAEVAKFLNSKARIIRVHPNARRMQKRRKAAKNQHVTDWHWLNKIDNSYVVSFTMEYADGVGTLQFTADVDVEKKYVFNVFWGGDTPPTPPTPPPPGNFTLQVTNSKISLTNVYLQSDLWQFNLRKLLPGRVVSGTIKADELEHLLLPEILYEPPENRKIFVYIEQEPPDKQTLAIEGNDTTTPTVTLLNNLYNGDILQLGFLVSSSIEKYFVFENLQESVDYVRITGVFDGSVEVEAGSEITGWLGYETGIQTITFRPSTLIPDIYLHLRLKLSNPDWEKLFNYNNDSGTITMTVDTDDDLFKELSEIRVKFLAYPASKNYFQVNITNPQTSVTEIDGSSDIPHFEAFVVGPGMNLSLDIYDIEKAYEIHLTPHYLGDFNFVKVEINHEYLPYVTVENDDTQDVTVKINEGTALYNTELPFVAYSYSVAHVEYSIQLTFRNTDLSQTIDSNLTEFNGTFRNTNIRVNTNNLAVKNYINVYGSGTPGKVMRVESTGNVNPGMTITKINDQQAKIEWTRTGAENEFQYRIGIYEE